MGIVREQRVELREVLVEPQDVSDRVEHLARGAAGDDRVARTCFANDDGLRPGAERELDRPGVVVDPVRRQVGDAVRVHRPPEVDRLSAGADELELDAGHRALA